MSGAYLRFLETADAGADEMHLISLADDASAAVDGGDLLLSGLLDEDDFLASAAAPAPAPAASRKRNRYEMEEEDDDEDEEVDDEEVRAAAAELDDLVDPITNARSKFKRVRTRDSSTRRRVTGLTKAGDLAPSVARLMGEANSLFVANRVEETMAVLSKVVAAAPTHVPAHMLLSSLHEDRGDINKAYQAALVAFRSDNESTGYIARRIAGLARELGFAEHAADMYERASKLDPSDGASLLDAAALRVELSDRKKAIRCYQRAMKLANTHLSLPELSVRIAELAYAGKDRKTALQALEDALNFCMGGAPVKDAEEEEAPARGRGRGKKKARVEPVVLPVKYDLAVHATDAANLLCEIQAAQGQHAMVAQWCERIRAFYNAALDARRGLPPFPVHLDAQYAIALMKSGRAADAVTALNELQEADPAQFGDVMAEAAMMAATCGIMDSAHALTVALRRVPDAAYEPVEFMRMTAAEAIVTRQRGEMAAALAKFLDLLAFAATPQDMLLRLYEVVNSTGEYEAFAARVVQATSVALDDTAAAAGLAGVARQAVQHNAHHAASLILARALGFIPAATTTATRAARFRVVLESTTPAAFVDLVETCIPAMATSRPDEAQRMSDLVAKYVLRNTKTVFAVGIIHADRHPSLFNSFTAAQQSAAQVAVPDSAVPEEADEEEAAPAAKPKAKARRPRKSNKIKPDEAAFLQHLNASLAQTAPEIDSATMRAMAAVAKWRQRWPTDPDFLYKHTNPSLTALAAAEVYTSASVSRTKSQRLASLREQEEADDEDMDEDNRPPAPVPLPDKDDGILKDTYETVLADIHHGLFAHDEHPSALFLSQRFKTKTGREHVAQDATVANNNVRRMERRIRMKENLNNAGMVAYMGEAALSKGSYIDAAWYYLQVWRLSPQNPLSALAAGAALMQCANSRTQQRRPRIAFMALVALMVYRRLRVSIDAEHKVPITQAAREGHTLLHAMCVTCRLQCMPLEVPPALIHREVNYNLGRACHLLDMRHAAIHFYEAALQDLPMHTLTDPSTPLQPAGAASAASAVAAGSQAAVVDTTTFDGPYAQFDMRREAAHNLASLLMERRDRMRAREVVETFLKYD